MSSAKKRVNRSQRGFTLTELLVAMAIFLVLASALVTLFTSAVHSVRQAYATIDAFEQGRVATTTLSRDLTNAFTSREYGDVYNFYGRYDGFMFVGALEDGRIGRVTYAFHKIGAAPEYQTTIRERWGDIAANVHRQASRLLREQGYTGSAVAANADTVVGNLAGAYGLSLTTPADTLVDFNVGITYESLIRYEEPGVSDLDYFNMSLTYPGAATPVSLDWPYVDPIDPANDGSPAGLDGNAQQDFILDALNPILANTANDLRTLYADINNPSASATCPDGGWEHPVTGECIYLRVLGPAAFQQMINARKREFWVRMLSGDKTLGAPALNDVLTSGCTGYWYDESYHLSDPTVVNDLERRTVNEYVVADGIIARATLYDVAFESALPVGFGTGAAMDALDADVKFTYGDGENAPVEYFNDYNNLRDPNNPDGVDADANPPNPPDGIFDSVPTLVGRAHLTISAIAKADVIEADKTLADNMLGDRSSRQNLGSPLLPRIPAVVTPQFWVTRSKRTPGSADIRQRFVQAIQVPAATGRTTESTVALGPGGAF